MGKTREAIAALDLGTSRLRVGAWLPGQRQITVVATQANSVRCQAGGSATCSFSEQWSGVTALLRALGDWCRAQGVTQLQLGLCGQVSSLLCWDATSNRPLRDRFPMWMDHTCAAQLPELRDMLAGGQDRAWLGTRLPVTANWLAAKILHHHRTGGERQSRILQIQDAIFLRLTRQCLTHPGSQVSLVDQRRWAYATNLLDAIDCAEERLPELAPQGQVAMRNDLARTFALPPTMVHVGLQDTYATVAGLLPEVGEGVLLAGTSEVIGVLSDRPATPQRALCARLAEQSWLIYGSSNSGGATIAWLLKNVLQRPADLPDAELLRAALAAGPGADGVLCLPYPGGERAPLWNHELTASFTGLRAHHGPGHLLRAVLEGVALARRQAAEALEQPLMGRLLVAGGSSSNAMWNRIRAAVFAHPLTILKGGEAALIGVMAHVLQATGGDAHRLRSVQRFTTVEPDPEWVRSYASLYPRFVEAHGTSRLHEEAIHA